MTIRETLLSTCALILGATILTGGKAAADTVFPDDVIVQGSLCAGFDCVNNESFGFDTIRMKENNLRLNFMDTSVSPFPNVNWTITANDSTSGGASYLAFDDVTNSKRPFTVTANAPTNSLFVSSSGNVGLGTAAPGLDLSITTTDTPATRLEQTNGGGFSAQTWDIGGNEANFFVRDLTGGSRLSFRIRPGAPTSSLDIAANGNIGVGTASPVTGTGGRVLHVNNTSGAAVVRLGDGAANGRQWELQSTVISSTGALNFSNITDGSNPMTILSNGNVGIGNTTPAAQLHTTGGVTFGGIACSGANLRTDATGVVSCAVSSRQFKNITGDLAANVALTNVMALRPQTGSYKETPEVPEHWLIAEDVAAVDPALAVFKNGAPFAIKTPNVVADLVAVVQQQQRRIDELERRLSAK